MKMTAATEVERRQDPDNATVPPLMRKENAEMFIKPCGSFSLPNLIEKGRLKAKKSHDGHRVKCNQQPI